jgi:sugar transferase (PEP-CTERM system associated)
VRDIFFCKLEGIEVVDAPSFYEEMTGKLLLEAMRPSWLIFCDGFRVTPFRRMYKRAFDIGTVLIGLVLSLPFLPFIAVAIALDSEGPIFFRQTRVGEGEQPFELIKFRTMRKDAENGTGAVWAQKDDARVTRVGKFLRKARLDEFPQLWNVLRGDMSLIGPRPERPEFVNKLKMIIPYYSERHVVKPGITGWAQIKYPYGASVLDAIEKLQFDLFYIKNMTPLLDLLIVVETIKVMLFGRGGR